MSEINRSYIHVYARKSHDHDINICITLGHAYTSNQASTQIATYELILLFSLDVHVDPFLGLPFGAAVVKISVQTQYCT